MKESTLLKFAKLWKEAKTDELMDLFTEDATYKPSIELAGKCIFRGKEEIANAVELIQAYDHSISSRVMNIVICNDFGFWEWEYTKSDDQKIFGCDCFKFKGNKILEKNAFRKVKITEQCSHL